MVRSSIAKTFCIFALFFLLSACSSARRYGYETYKADEFVIDSHKIKEGKMSISEMQGVEMGDMPPDAFEEYRDVVWEDDVLAIVVMNPDRPELTEQYKSLSTAKVFIVRHGKIQLPGIDPVEVAGLTLEESKAKLQEALRMELPNVDLYLTYLERRERKVELTGNVAVPDVPVDGNMRLYELLSLARVRATENLFMSYVLRDGKPLPIDMARLLSQGDMSQNIVMRPRDKVYIADATDAKVMLMGEVGSPRTVNVAKGSISLREALVSAGGIPYTGNKDYIYVIRGNIARPKVYVLSWDHVLHFPNDSLLLMAGDTVYVAAKPITEWNRFISQLMPSFGYAQTFQTAYTNFR